MRHSVYPFGLILKELRRDAGLAVLAAADATEYGNYERWESGATRVGAQYLRIIARAFGVTDELWLLLYAWLVDRWTPAPGERAVDLARVNASRVLRDLPVDKFAADTTGTNLVLGSSRHLDVALLCLGARYQRGKQVVLIPVRRSPLPDRGPGESVLQATYADVEVDGLRRVSGHCSLVGTAGSSRLSTRILTSFPTWRRCSPRRRRSRYWPTSWRVPLRRRPGGSPACSAPNSKRCAPWSGPHVVSR